MQKKQNKKIWIAIIVALAVAIYWGAKKLQKNNDSKEKNSLTKIEGTTYWTCPMHPFIHQDHSGECPICHMKLVQVKANQTQNAVQDQTRSQVQVSQDQLNLVGVQKHNVEKMSLRVSIPVSGRFISSSSVVFQIYESDLRYIKPGLALIGESSFNPEDEMAGVVTSVDSIVDPTSRTVRVVGTIKKGTRSSASETGFRGDIQFELQDRVAIPESSVLHTGSGDLVYLFTEGNKLSAKQVKLGLKSEGFYDVLDGIKEGDVISSGPNFLIDSEAKIRGAGEAHDHSNH